MVSNNMRKFMTKYCCYAILISADRQDAGKEEDLAAATTLELGRTS